MDRKSLLRLTFISVCFFMLVGCSTYYLSTESMLEQFSYSHPDLKITESLYISGTVLGNDLTEIKCTDKNGFERTVHINTHTNVRITKKDSSSTIFYFNTLIIKDSLITGSKSHFVEVNIIPIKLSD